MIRPLSGTEAKLSNHLSYSTHLLLTVTFVTFSIFDHTCASCPAGLQPPDCARKCRAGYFGINCASRCPSTCLDQTCEPDSGLCPKCYPGFGGPKCVEKCPQGFYGRDCKMLCPINCLKNQCDPFSGFCKQCPPGYSGSICGKRLSAGNERKSITMVKQKASTNENAEEGNNDALYAVIVLASISIPACVAAIGIYYYRKKIQSLQETAARRGHLTKPIFRGSSDKGIKNHRVTPVADLRRQRKEYQLIETRGDSYTKESAQRGLMTNKNPVFKTVASSAADLGKKQKIWDVAGKLRPTNWLEKEAEQASSLQLVNSGYGKRRQPNETEEFDSPQLDQVLKEHVPLRLSDAANYSRHLFFKTHVSEKIADTKEDRGTQTSVTSNISGQSEDSGSFLTLEQAGDFALQEVVVESGDNRTGASKTNLVGDRVSRVSLRALIPARSTTTLTPSLRGSDTASMAKPTWRSFGKVSDNEMALVGDQPRSHFPSQRSAVLNDSDARLRHSDASSVAACAAVSAAINTRPDTPSMCKDLTPQTEACRESAVPDVSIFIDERKSDVYGKTTQPLTSDSSYQRIRRFGIDNFYIKKAISMARGALATRKCKRLTNSTDNNDKLCMVLEVKSSPSPAAVEQESLVSESPEKAEVVRSASAESDRDVGAVVPALEEATTTSTADNKSNLLQGQKSISQLAKGEMTPEMKISANEERTTPMFNACAACGVPETGLSKDVAFDDMNKEASVFSDFKISSANLCSNSHGPPSSFEDIVMPAQSHDLEYKVQLRDFDFLSVVDDVSSINETAPALQTRTEEHDLYTEKGATSSMKEQVDFQVGFASQSATSPVANNTGNNKSGLPHKRKLRLPIIATAPISLFGPLDIPKRRYKHRRKRGRLPPWTYYPGLPFAGLTPVPLYNVKNTKRTGGSRKGRRVANDMFLKIAVAVPRRRLAKEKSTDIASGFVGKHVTHMKKGKLSILDAPGRTSGRLIELSPPRNYPDPLDSNDECSTQVDETEKGSSSAKSSTAKEKLSAYSSSDRQTKKRLKPSIKPKLEVQGSKLKQELPGSQQKGSSSSKKENQIKKSEDSSDSQQISYEHSKVSFDNTSSKRHLSNFDSDAFRTYHAIKLTLEKAPTPQPRPKPAADVCMCHPTFREPRSILCHPESKQHVAGGDTQLKNSKSKPPISFSRQRSGSSISESESEHIEESEEEESVNLKSPIIKLKKGKAPAAAQQPGKRQDQSRGHDVTSPLDSMEESGDYTDQTSTSSKRDLGDSAALAVNDSEEGSWDVSRDNEDTHVESKDDHDNSLEDSTSKVAAHHDFQEVDTSEGSRQSDVSEDDSREAISWGKLPRKGQRSRSPKSNSQSDSDGTRNRTKTQLSELQQSPKGPQGDGREVKTYTIDTDATVTIGDASTSGDQGPLSQSKKKEHSHTSSSLHCVPDSGKMGSSDDTEPKLLSNRQSKPLHSLSRSERERLPPQFQKGAALDNKTDAHKPKTLLHSESAADVHGDRASPFSVDEITENGPKSAHTKPSSGMNSVSDESLSGEKEENATQLDIPTDSNRSLLSTDRGINYSFAHQLDVGLSSPPKSNPSMLDSKSRSTLNEGNAELRTLVGSLKNARSTRTAANKSDSDNDNVRQSSVSPKSLRDSPVHVSASLDISFRKWECVSRTSAYPMPSLLEDFIVQDESLSESNTTLAGETVAGVGTQSASHPAKYSDSQEQLRCLYHKQDSTSSCPHPEPASSVGTQRSSVKYRYCDTNYELDASAIVFPQSMFHSCEPQIAGSSEFQSVAEDDSERYFDALESLDMSITQPRSTTDIYGRERVGCARPLLNKNMQQDTGRQLCKNIPERHIGDLRLIFKLKDPGSKGAPKRPQSQAFCTGDSANRKGSWDSKIAFRFANSSENKHISCKDQSKRREAQLNKAVSTKHRQSKKDGSVSLSSGTEGQPQSAGTRSKRHRNQSEDATGGSELKQTCSFHTMFPAKSGSVREEGNPQSAYSSFDEMFSSYQDI